MKAFSPIVAATPDSLASLASKVRWRLGVPTILFMLLSSLDRVNISFAALQMNRELGFTPTQYGFGAGLVFAGFLLGQYPSVLLMQRYAMHRWIAGCAVIWGLTASATAFVTSAQQFYVLRVALGAAEGGLAPGIVLYLTQFAPHRARASTFALPMMAIPLSIIVGGPLSGWLMGKAFPLGLASWRWMLLAESLPTILLGIAAWFYFPDRPDDASWVTAAERTALAASSAGSLRGRAGNDWSVLAQPLVWACGLLWFCLLSGSYGIMFWLPQMIKRLSGLTPAQIGWINALPWLGVVLGTYYNAAHSDKTGERFWHIAVPALIAATALLAAWSIGPGIAGMIALFVAGLGLGSATGAFWALPISLLGARTLAVGAVAINITGTAGGLVMPHLVGYVLERTGTLAGPTLVVAAALLLAAVMVVSLRLRVPGSGRAAGA
jgi:ACS family tartrate transporter-like MFS transporter